MAPQNENTKLHTLNMVYGVLFAVVALFALIALVVITSRTDTSSQSATVVNTAPAVDSITAASATGGAALGTSASGLTLSPRTNAEPSKTTTLFVHGTASDANGCTELDNAASVWRLVVYKSTESSGCTADNNDCYIVSVAGNDTGNLTLGATAPGANACDGGTDTQVSYQMTVPLYYYADATDGDASDWNAYLLITDDPATPTALIGNSTSADFDAKTQTALNVPSSLAYGTVGLNAESSEATLVVTNAGNDTTLDTGIKQHATTVGDNLWSCTQGGTFSNSATVGTRWSLTTGTAYASGTQMLGTNAATAMSLTKPTTVSGAITATTDDIYLKLKLPATGYGGSCTSTLTLTAQ
ncbi:MAG: hypothetical protein AAB855_01240 [Patescibacteria group bacterium]